MVNKPASLLVVPLGGALNGIPPSWCGRQMAGKLLSELVIALSQHCPGLFFSSAQFSVSS